MEETIEINKLSSHLFWDVDKETLSFDKNAEFVVGRIMDYGLMEDWIVLRNSIGIQKIAEIAMNIRDLDPKSLHFIATLANIPIEKFRCYTIQQSIPPHWNF